MTLQLRSFILAALMSFSAVIPAEARTIRCDAIFQPTVADVLDSVNRDNANYLFRGKSFEEYAESQSWFRRRKIRKLVQDIEVRSFPSEAALERYVVELGTALYGPKDILDRWWNGNSYQRLEESTVYLIRDKLIHDGLLKTWGDSFNPQQVSMVKKALDRIWTLQNTFVGQLTRLPLRLPQLKDRQISTELMFKVIRDGFDAHAEEVRVELTLQNKIEAYNTFRRLYAPIVFGIMLIVQMENAYLQMKHDKEVQFQAVITQLRDQREKIEKLVPEIKKQEADNAYNAAVEEFKSKWGEPPTEDEAKELRTKIEKALNVN